MQKKIKMVFVSQNMAPFRFQWLEALSEFIDITVYHLNDYSSTVNSKYLSFNTECLRINTDYRKIGNKKFFKIKNIINEKPDILVLDGYGFIGQIALIAYLRIHKISFYMSVDGGIIPQKESWYKKLIKQFCVNSPSGFFSTSEVTDRFISYYLKKKTPFYRHYFSTVYSKDICKLTPFEKQKYKKKLNLDNKFVVIAVGRFIHVKGFDILLKAAKNADKDICFVFVGGKPIEEYNDLVKQIPPENVRFIDFLGRDELKEYYYASDVFAMPSRGDIWGLVIGEAMAYSLPIIGSDTCIAALSMVKDYENGFIITDQNPESYYSKILELKNNDELYNKIAENNYNFIKKYAIDISVQNDIKNIDLILEKNKDRGCP